MAAAQGELVTLGDVLVLSVTGGSSSPALVSAGAPGNTLSPVLSCDGNSALTTSGGGASTGTPNATIELAVAVNMAEGRRALAVAAARRAQNTAAAAAALGPLLRSSGSPAPLATLTPLQFKAEAILASLGMGLVVADQSSATSVLPAELSTWLAGLGDPTLTVPPLCLAVGTGACLASSYYTPAQAAALAEQLIAPSASPAAPDNSVSLGAIVGGAVGGLLVLAIIVALGVVLLLRARRKRQTRRQRQQRKTQRRRSAVGITSADNALHRVMSMRGGPLGRAGGDAASAAAMAAGLNRLRAGVSARGVAAFQSGLGGGPQNALYTRPDAAGRIAFDALTGTNAAEIHGRMGSSDEWEKTNPLHVAAAASAAHASPPRSLPQRPVQERATSRAATHNVSDEEENENDDEDDLDDAAAYAAKQDAVRRHPSAKLMKVARHNVGNDKYDDKAYAADNAADKTAAKAAVRAAEDNELQRRLSERSSRIIASESVSPAVSDASQTRAAAAKAAADAVVTSALERIASSHALAAAAASPAKRATPKKLLLSSGKSTSRSKRLASAQ